MNFENQSGLKTDGIAGPAVWTDLLADVQSGHGNANPYNYVLVNKALPETATVYSNGAVVYSTPANTGVAGAPTVDGTFPVYARYTVTTMTGTNPDGSQYVDPGHPLGQLLQRRRRPARLRPRLLRLPPERRVRRDAAGQRRGRLPADSARDPGHGRGLTVPVRSHRDMTTPSTPMRRPSPRTRATPTPAPRTPAAGPFQVVRNSGTRRRTEHGAPTPRPPVRRTATSPPPQTRAERRAARAEAGRRDRRRAHAQAARSGFRQAADLTGRILIGAGDHPSSLHRLPDLGHLPPGVARPEPVCASS